MELFYSLISIFVGLVVGSFVNVLVVRLPKDESIVSPGSHCPACGTPIRWYDNIPVLSYLLLRGRCRSCGVTISIRYPVIELLTALLFLAMRLRFGWSEVLLVRDWPFAAGIIAITFIDLEHRIIPDELSLGGLLLGLVTSVAVPLGLMQSAAGAALGFGIFYGFSWLYYRISGRSGLGGGDVKLLAMIGAFVGPSGVIGTVLISSVLGSVIGILVGVFSGRKQILRTAIPYGPFLVIGGLFYYLLGDVVWLQFMNPT